MFIDKFFEKIKKYRTNPKLVFIFFCINVLFIYLFFGTKLKYSELILLSILLTLTIATLIGIFTKISYRQIPDYYSEWAKTSMRVIIFISLFILFIYHTYKFNLWI